MGDQMAKGEDYEKKAEKKINGWGFFGSKYEDAADLYDKAANCYKLAKSCIHSSLSPSSPLISLAFEIYSIDFPLIAVRLFILLDQSNKKKLIFF